jgi:hypothetical protein
MSCLRGLLPAVSSEEKSTSKLKQPLAQAKTFEGYEVKCECSESIRLPGWFRRAPIDGEQGEIQIGSCPLVFSLMCWGYWGKQCEYNEKAYSVQVLLQDHSPGTAWIPEPWTNAKVECHGSFARTSGTFRHVHCKRMSITGIPFNDLTCCDCARIPHVT